MLNSKTNLFLRRTTNKKTTIDFDLILSYRRSIDSIRKVCDVIDQSKVKQLIGESCPVLINWNNFRPVGISIRELNICTSGFATGMEKLTSADQMLSIELAPRKSLHGGRSIDG